MSTPPRKHRFIVIILNDFFDRLKAILVMDDDDKREKMMEQHHRVGKCFKTDLQQNEKQLDEIESNLIVRSNLTNSILKSSLTYTHSLIYSLLILLYS